MSRATVRVIVDPKEFESLSGVWNSFLPKSSNDNSIYLTHEWLSTWWKHFGDEKKLNILLIEKEHQIIGIVPLMKVEYRAGLISLHILETIGSVNCNYAGLIPSGNSKEVIAALLAYLEKELVRSRLVLKLPLVPEDSQFLDMLRRHDALFSNSLVIQEKVMTLAPYIALPTTWDEYFHSLSRNRRMMLRRAVRTLEKAHSFEFQEHTMDSLEDGLSKFFDLHQRRWQSVNISGIFSNPKMKEFYRDIASQFLKKKWLHFSYLTVENEIVSAIYGFVYNRKFYYAIIARDIRYLKYRVGHLHVMYLIKDAIKKHLKEFDFLRGAEPYKFHWAKSAKRYMQVIIIKKGFWSYLRLKFLHIFLRFCEIRENSLRDIYSLYLIKIRERNEKKRMGLLKRLK